jgi:hypothetical protein
MKRFFFRPLLVVALALGVSLPALADTIRLKDGSVLHGQVVGFKDQQFTVLLGSGARGRKSRITVYMEDVESIEFDSTGVSGNTSYTPPTTNPDSSPTFFQVNARVRADNANNGWTNTGLVVRRGQRLRINASGRISLGNNRFATPDGLANIPDRDKLMRNQPTGGLIAVIGDDNDDFIFIGRSRDFVVQRDGVLFLGVNEGNLSDNSGNYDVVIEAEAVGGNPR